MQEELQLFKNLVTTLQKQNAVLNQQRATLQKQYKALHDEYLLYQQTHHNDTQLLSQTQIELDRAHFQHTAEIQRLKEELENERKAQSNLSQLGTTVSHQFHQEVDRIKGDLSSLDSQLGDKAVGAVQERADLMQEHIQNVLSFREELARSLRDMRNIKMTVGEVMARRIQEELNANKISQQQVKQDEISDFKQAINRRQATISQLRNQLEEKTTQVGQLKGENQVLNLKIKKFEAQKLKCLHLNFPKFDKSVQTERIIDTIQEQQEQQFSNVRIVRKSEFQLQNKRNFQNQRGSMSSSDAMNETKRVKFYNIPQKSLEQLADLLKIHSFILTDLQKAKDSLENKFGPEVELLIKIVNELKRQVGAIQTVAGQLIQPNKIPEQKVHNTNQAKQQTDDPTSLGQLARDIADSPVIQSHHLNKYFVKPFHPNHFGRSSRQFFNRLNLSDLQYRLHEMKIQHEILKRHSLRNNL